MGLCLFIINNLYKPPLDSSLLESSLMLSLAAVVGVLIGSILYFTIGFQKGLMLTLTLALLCGTGILYLEDRNSEFVMMKHPKS